VQLVLILVSLKQWQTKCEDEIMNHSDFNKLIEQTISNIHSLSTLKGGEYAGDSDRLENFKRNAAAFGVCPELIWGVYAGKHWDAISQYVKDQVAGKTRMRGEPIEGRLDDLIVYCILLKGIIQEGNSQKRKTN